MRCSGSLSPSNWWRAIRFEGEIVPTNRAFYGIKLAMYFEEHPPPHFHVTSGSSRARISIETGEIYVGRSPKNAARLVKEWAEIHLNLLYKNRRRSQERPSLLKIGALE
jgi:hypothetical protein